MEKLKYFVRDYWKIFCIFIVIVILIIILKNKSDNKKKALNENIVDTSTQINYYEEDEKNGDIWTIKEENKVEDIWTIPENESNN